MCHPLETQAYFVLLREEIKAAPKIQGLIQGAKRPTHVEAISKIIGYLF